MIQHHFSRRRLLCSLLSGLAAWLCPRSPRAATTSITESANIHQPSPPYFYTAYSYDGSAGSVTIYTYDGENRLCSVQTEGEDGCRKTTKGSSMEEIGIVNYNYDGSMSFLTKREQKDDTNR